MFVRQLVFPRESGGGVARIHRAVAIPQLRPLAGRTPFGIGFADDDRRALQLRVRSNDPKAFINDTQLIGDTHPNVAIRVSWRAFGVEGHEIQRRADVSSDAVGATQAVFEEFPHELAAAACDVWSAHPRRRQRAAHARHSIIVQLAELLRRAAPIADVRLVPGFPIPGLDLGAAISLDAVFCPLVNQFLPLGVVLRWIRPPGEDFVVLGRGGPMVLIRLRFDRKVLGHETDLHVRTEAALQISVENPVEDGPVVNRIAVAILGISPRGPPLQGGRAVA